MYKHNYKAYLKCELSLSLFVTCVVSVRKVRVMSCSRETQYFVSGMTSRVVFSCREATHNEGHYSHLVISKCATVPVLKSHW